MLRRLLQASLRAGARVAPAQVRQRSTAAAYLLCVRAPSLRSTRAAAPHAPAPQADGTLQQLSRRATGFTLTALPCRHQHLPPGGESPRPAPLQAAEAIHAAIHVSSLAAPPPSHTHTHTLTPHALPAQVSCSRSTPASRAEASPRASGRATCRVGWCGQRGGLPRRHPALRRRRTARSHRRRSQG
jgi:hypothetical protein